ncbi:hypothetical protein ABQE70_16950, partial [Xanthomonas campestris pv. campestris]
RPPSSAININRRPLVLAGIELRGVDTHMPTDVAVQTPVEQSLQRLEIANTDRQQALVQSQQQEMDNRVREGSAMRMG